MKTINMLLKINKLNVDSDMLDEQDNEGRTALMVAAGQDLYINLEEIDFNNTLPIDYIETKWTNVDGAQILLDLGAEPNIQDKEGNTALMFATSWGEDTNIVTKLLTQGADINIKNKYDRTALDYAIEFWLNKKSGNSSLFLRYYYEFTRSKAINAWFKEWKNEAMIETLLDSNASVSYQSQDTLPTPLLKALNAEFSLSALIYDYKTSERKLKIIERLINNETISMMDEDGNDPLNFSASFVDNLAVFNFVLQHTVNLNSQNKLGNTALMTIISDYPLYPDKTIMLKKLKMLLGRKPNLNLQDQYGKTAVMLALAVDIPTLEMLLNSGASVNVRDNDNQTALWYADVVIVDLLVNHGIEINAQDNYGRTALMDAVLFNKTDRVKVLLKHGADVTINDDQYNMTAIVESHSNDDIFRLLMRSGQVRGDDVLFLIMTSNYAYYKPKKVVGQMKILFYEEQVNINAVNTDGQTALMLAIQKEQQIWFDLILEQNPNIDQQDNNGFTALMYVAQQNYAGYFAKMLLEHGASPSITSNAGKTALDIAIHHCEDDMCRVFSKHVFRTKN